MQPLSHVQHRYSNHQKTMICNKMYRRRLAMLIFECIEKFAAIYVKISLNRHFFNQEIRNKSQFGRIFPCLSLISFWKFGWSENATDYLTRVWKKIMLKIHTKEYFKKILESALEQSNGMCLLLMSSKNQSLPLILVAVKGK